MLDLKLIDQNPQAIIANLIKRNVKEEEATLKVKELTDLNQRRKQLIQETDGYRSERNKISQEFGALKKKGEDTSALTKRLDELKDLMGGKEAEQNLVESEFNQKLLHLPNMLEPEVPAGKDENDNVEIRKWGEPRKFSFDPQAHYELGEKLGIIDLKRGAKITGSRFYFLWKEGARLERALINFFLDFYSARGYQEIWSPFMVNEKAMTGTGQMPKFKEDLFKIEGLDYYLIPTAEVPVTNLYSDEVIEENQMPQHFCGFTACFRKEAGAYGKDTRGIVRVHQFSKVELVKIVSENTSNDEHEKLLRDVTDSLEALGLSYRVIILCGGDIGFSARKCYDVEVWLPSENKYREISSVSNFGDFQARRANIKYKTKDNKKLLAHTLNGSGLAIGRTMVALLENYQNKDGSVTIPDILVPYMGGIKTIGAKP